MTTFPKSVRLLRRGDFRRVMDSGVKAVCPDVVLFGAPRPDESSGSTAPRIGLVVSRKVGNSVVRNRVKRHLREAWRAQRGELEQRPDFARLDVAVVARASAAELSGSELADGLRRCLERLVRQVRRRADTQATRSDPPR